MMAIIISFIYKSDHPVRVFCLVSFRLFSFEKCIAYILGYAMSTSQKRIALDMLTHKCIIITNAIQRMLYKN